jgi:hypothetical protein
LLAAMVAEYWILQAIDLTIENIAFAAAVSSFIAAGVLLCIAMMTRLKAFKPELDYGE